MRTAPGGVARGLWLILVCATAAACTKGGCKKGDAEAKGGQGNAQPAPAEPPAADAPKPSPPPAARTDITIENDGPPPKPVASIPFDALATVPADTPYLFVALDAPSDDVRTRFVWDLAPVVARSRDASAVRLAAGSGDAID